MTIHDILKQYWGYDAFRPLQEDIIQSVLSGKDTLALLPTGGGKSICFQMPAMAKDGLCLVVSPLIALMKDQVENLLKRDINAAAVYSGMSRKQINMTLDNAISGAYKFLYLSPERLKSKSITERLAYMNISMLAVDEAHCISQWGYDFRPEYLEIAKAREVLPGVPVLALTATATSEVIDDIQEKLGFKKKNVFVKSFERKNISYVAEQTEQKKARMLQILSKVAGTGLVYVRNRKQTQELALYLLQNRQRADYYHAGLPHEVRMKKQDDWIKGKTRVMVCTNAFGMGIDKPDVRVVIHYEMPESLESYYQEAGRAGRDEQRSYCILLHNEADDTDALQKLEQAFPPVDQIRQVYQALSNYYAVPIGADANGSYDFDMQAFCSRFSLQPFTVHASLNVLHQCGYVLLSEYFFESSKIRIITSHELLYKFQVENPAYDDFIKLLLRSYGGLFDQYVQVSEKIIAKRCERDEDFVKKVLQKLHQLQLFDYVPQTDKPQLTFLVNRVDAKTLDLSGALLDQRKKTATRKLDAMTSYANNDLVCRSKMMMLYFGETASDCGVCDVCLRNKKKNLTAEEIQAVSVRIKNILQQTPLHIDGLEKQLPDVGKEKLVSVVRYLLDEDTLQTDKEERLIWIRDQK